MWLTRPAVRLVNILLIILAFGISAYAFSYLFVDHPFLGSKTSLPALHVWTVIFYMHVVGGGIALSVGWMQFWCRFRQRNLLWHRRLGKIYILVILVFGATSGLYLAIFANGPFATDLGFGCLAVCWFVSTGMAYIRILSKKVEGHKNWMIRSFALTFAAVTLRLWWPIFSGVFGVPFDEAYGAVAWFCWVPNLMFAEIIIHNNWIRL